MATLDITHVLNTETQVFSISQFDVLKETIENYANQYKNLVVTEEQIALAKLDRAELNRKKKAINDVKVAIKKNALSLLENQCNSLVGIIDEAVKNIDGQIKSFEETQKNIKREEIVNLYTTLESECISLEKIWNDKWLNKGYSLKEIEQEMKNAIDRFEKDKETLYSISANTGEFSYALSILMETLDINTAISKLNEYKKIAEQSAAYQPKIEEKITTDEKKYNIGFVITASASQIEKLSAFMSENKINFIQIPKSKVDEILGN